MKRLKVLYFVDNMGCGGIQSLLLDWASKINKDVFQIDFLVLDDGNKYENEQLLNDMGCNVYKIRNAKLDTFASFISYRKKVRSFFKKHHDYHVVHLNASSKNYYILKCAYKYKIPIRIAHSHNIGFQTTNFFKIVIGDILKTALKRYSTDFFACSEDAGKWLFGRKVNFTVLKNGINIEKYLYSSDDREKIRSSLDISNDSFVIGNIGRFVSQKNHKILLDIFCEYLKIDSNAILMLVGDGPLQEELIKQAKKLNIYEHVIFTGYRDDIGQLLSAMDCFCLTSSFEGLGMVLVEAQISGLRCLAPYGAVPKEAKASPLLEFLDENDKNEWVAKLKLISNCDIKHSNYLEQIIENGYDSKETVKILEKYYKKDVVEV